MIILDEPAQTYHANPAVSFHRLLVAERCPLLYRKLFVTKEIGQAKEDTPAMAFGRAAHTAILEGEDRFKAEYIWTEEEMDRRTKSGKALWEFMGSQGKTVLKWEDVLLIRRLAESVRSNPDAAALLADGKPEVTVRVHDERWQFPQQGRLDWLCSNGDRVDLKTCETLDDFAREVESRKYFRQLSYYKGLMCLETGAGAAGRDDFILAVEKSEPYRCGVFKLSAVYLDFGEAENEAALARLAECYATDTWPSGVEGVTELGPSQRLAERHAAVEAEGAFT